MTFPRIALKLGVAFVAVGTFFAASANAGTNWSSGVSVPGIAVTPAAPTYYELGSRWEERRMQRWEERRADRREWRRRQRECEQYRRYDEDRD